PQGKQQALEDGKKLLSQSPSGLAGAMIYATLAPQGIKLQPGPEAATVESLLKEFPKDWLKILDQPNLFYTIRMEPVRVGVPVGDPMLVRVTVTNTSPLPLTI